MVLKQHKKGQLYINKETGLVIMCTESNVPYLINGTDPTILSGVVLKSSNPSEVGDYKQVWVRSKFDPITE